MKIFPQKFSLANKLVVYVSAFLLLVVVPLSEYFYLEYKNIAEMQINRYLSSLAEATEVQLSLFFGGNKMLVANWSSDGYIRLEFEALSKEGGEKKALSLGKYLKTEKHPIVPRVVITDIFDLSGVAIVSTEKERVGHREPQDELDGEYAFSRAKVASFGTAFISLPTGEEGEAGHTPGVAMWHISAPIVSLKTGATIGVMVNHIRGDDITDIFSGKWSSLRGAVSGVLTRFKTSEIYLVNKDGLMITPSRFVDDAILKQEVNTAPVRACAESGGEFVGHYENYRGIKVRGASSCMADHEMTLVVEIGEDELFAELREEQNRFFLLAVLFLMVGILGSILLSKFFLKDIKVMQQAVLKVGKGDLNTKISVVAKDEIGDLAVAFNTMIATIRNNREELQTSKDEIQIKANNLEQDIKKHEEQEMLMDESKKATFNILEDMIHTKEKLEVEGHRLQTIISSISDGLILIDGAYQVILINPQALNMLAVPSQEIVGKDLRSVITILKSKKVELRLAEWPMEEMFLTKKAVSVGLEAELSLVTSSRTKPLPITLSVAPLGGGLAGGIIVIHDVTEDRALDDAKSGFISVASHQLRTPLTTIRWYSEMLLSDDAGALTPSQKDFLAEIHGGAKRLYQTIDLLLGISRVESGKIKVEKSSIDLEAFTREVAKELALSMDQKKITFTVAPPAEPIPVSLDPLQLRQVVINFISNAVRYTNDNGTIEARWARSDDGKEVVYAVRDNGIGIPKAQQSRIFTKFFRAENALQKVPDGSGLGLALVKELVESWGGRAWFETEEGKGTTFFFTIPLAG